MRIHGHSARLDHTAEDQIFKAFDAEKATGMTLTESYAMSPAAVSGFYLAHPESHYFAVSKIAMDQANDWATRSGHTEAEAKYWLAPLL
jgi:5-methyltetrahydrofolate--homocysteine methyltransferase